MYAAHTVSFEVTLKKGVMSSVKRGLVVDLHKHVVTQLLGKGGDRKSIPCREYAKLKRKGAEMQVVLDDGRGHRRNKWMVFRSAAEALKFEQVVRLDQASGDHMRHVFCRLDRNGSGRVCAEDLRQAMSRYGLEADVTRMIDASGENVASLAYASFFLLYLGVNVEAVRSERACLATWAKIASESAAQDASKKPSYEALMPGETVSHVVEHVKFKTDPWQRPLVGVLYVTTYRLKLIAYESCLRQRGATSRTRQGLGPRGVPEKCFGEVSLPHGATYKLECKESQREMRIVCRGDGRCVSLRFEADAAFFKSLRCAVEDACFPIGETESRCLEHTFAFSYALLRNANKVQENLLDGWTIFDATEEYTRLGFLGHERSASGLWRLWCDSYDLVETYPLEFVLPRRLDDSTIREAAAYRSKRRLPTAVWRSPRTGALLCRSSQPMVGLSQKSSRADQALLNAYRTQGFVVEQRIDVSSGKSTPARKHHPFNAPPMPPPLPYHPPGQRKPRSQVASVLDRPIHIIDCRGRAAALGNRAQGKGTETVTDYQNATLKYCDIANIHTMRESQHALIDLLRTTGQPDDPKTELTADDISHPSGTAYLSALEQTGWLRHLVLILRASVHVAERLHVEGASVLAHCFAEKDHQLLTDHGFVFLSQVKKIHKFASYNPHTRQIVYQTPRRFIVNQAAAQERLLDVAATSQGDETSVSLRVTRRHRMYVAHADDFHKVPAEELLQHIGCGLRMLANAENGLGGSSNSHDDAVRCVFSRLQLRDRSEQHAFLWIYGRWLADGVLETAALRFRVADYGMQRYRSHLVEKLDTCCVSYLVSDSCVAVCDRDWVNLFTEEYRDPDEKRAILLRLFVPHLAGAAFNTILQFAGLSKRNRQAAHFFEWVFSLPKDDARAVLSGLSSARGEVHAPAACFRDDIIRLCLHAGYSARCRALASSGWTVLFSDCVNASRPMLRDARIAPYRPQRTWCVELPSGFVVVRRALAVSGNSTVLEATMPTIQANCSDGWDRTSQLTSTAQLLLDPHYRTLCGLGLLVEKEWCAFGHKFGERLGVAHRHDYRDKERSPVFLQWLECVNYVRAQFPRAFEFDEDLLVFLADAAHSGLFGTFLADTERQRKWELRVTKRTVSVWTYVLNHPSRFRNVHYTPYDGPLWPHLTFKRASVWHRFYSRWDPAAHPAPADLSGDNWTFDLGDDFERHIGDDDDEDTALQDEDDDDDDEEAEASGSAHQGDYEFAVD